MPKRILIVDDERLARQRVARFIRDRNENHVLAEASHGLDALGKIPLFLPDIIFLDIAMPGMSGFDLLYQLEERPFVLVFQTAFDKFALQAFEENACDYLLKPFPRERFNKALDRALARSPNGTELGGVESQVLEKQTYLTKIAVRHRNQLKIVNDAEIFAFVSRDHYTFVCTESTEYLCELSLAHLAKRLSPERFKQVHRNAIVRLDAIQSVSLGEAMAVHLGNGLALPVSRSNRALVNKLRMSV